LERPQTKNQQALGPRCPVCGNTRYRDQSHLRDAEAIDDRLFRIAACTRCGLNITLPSLTDFELKPWYHENYHGAGRKKKQLFSFFMQTFMALRVRSVKPCLHPGMTVVDYGAGDGRFVRTLTDRGIRAYGIENDAFQPADEGGRPDHPRVLTSLAALARRGISPDMVTLWHVLEHLADPCRDLSAIHAALPPAGRILVAVPNIQSGQAKVTGSNWYHLDPPRHRWHFSENHLRRVLSRAGFSDLQVKHLDLEFAPVGWWQSLLNCMHAGSGFPLHFFKRSRCRFDQDRAFGKLTDALSTALAGGFLLPLAFLFTLIEAACARGGTLLVIGRKGS
jgi:hypothetical protein